MMPKPECGPARERREGRRKFGPCPPAHAAGYKTKSEPSMGLALEMETRVSGAQSARRRRFRGRLRDRGFRRFLGLVLRVNFGGAVLFLDRDGSLAGASAQVIETRLHRFGLALHFDFFDVRRVDGKHALDPLAVAEAADRERF